MNINPDTNLYSGSNDANPYGLASKRSLEKKYLNFSFGNVLDGIPEHEDVGHPGQGDMPPTGDKIQPEVADSSGKEQPATIGQPGSTSKAPRWSGILNHQIYADQNVSGLPVYAGYGDSTRKIAQGVTYPESKDHSVHRAFGNYQKNTIEQFSVKIIGNEEGVTVRLRDYFGFFSRNDIERMAKLAKVKIPSNMFSRVKIYLNAKIIK